MMRTSLAARLRLCACAGMLLCLFGPAASVFAAATIFPEKRTTPFRDTGTLAQLDAVLATLTETARTGGTANDGVMGRIHDMAAALRYPLAGGDAIAAFLDTLPPEQDTRAQAKAAREAALQLARVLLNAAVEGTRAHLRAIHDLRSAETAAAPASVRAKLLAELESCCYAVGVFLQRINKWCLDPRYTNPVTGDSLLFLDETAARAAQAGRQAFLDRLETDRDNQDFIGAGVAEKVNALRFPFTDAVRAGFFLQRLFEAPGSEIERSTALSLAIVLFERHGASISLAQNHIAAIARARADDNVKQTLLRGASAQHQAALDLLRNAAERCRRAAGR